jgi:hypothetical protein
MEVLNTAPLDIKDEDTQLIKLKKMRFNAAIAEAKERYNLFKKGQTKFTDLVDVGQRVLTAQADLAQSPEERLRCWTSSCKSSQRRKIISTSKLKMERG